MARYAEEVDPDAVVRFARQVAFTARTVEHTLGELTLTGYRILTLVAQGDARASVIARLLAVGRPTVTYAVDALVDRGLVERVADVRDRRVMHLSLTADGAEELAAAEDRLRDRFGAVFARVEDAEVLLEGFDRFYQALPAARPGEGPTPPPPV